MRILPINPKQMTPEVRFVHDGVVNLVTRSQSPVKMMNADGALIGPFPPMLQFPQFGIPALTFVRSLDQHATLSKKVKEVAILTVGAAFNCRFELYAHEIMADHVGFSASTIAFLASGIRPEELNEEETIAYTIACILSKGKVVPDSVYARAIALLGNEGTAELIFLVGAYTLLAVVLNAFDVPAT